MIVTFGEMLIRLSPRGMERMGQGKDWELIFGGGEANTAVSLACFGKQTRYVTGLPSNEMGAACKRELARWGVDASCILEKEGRMGIYFYERGSCQRPAKVLYDRAGSVASQLTRDDLDWERIFEGADWFHFSGITPALGDSVAEALLEACKTAKAKGIPISCDLNYRKKMWTPQQAGRVMKELVPYASVLIATEDEVEEVLGIGSRAELPLRLTEVSREIKDRFNVPQTALMMRENRWEGSVWQASLYTESELFLSREYPMQVTDPVGAGDAFCAGLIYALTENYPSQKAVEFASAAACLKHSIEGDFNLATLEETSALAENGCGLEIQR